MVEPYKKSSTRETFDSLVVTVILAVFGTTFILQAFKIPTGSMEDTLLIGDHLLVNKFAFASHSGWITHFLPYREIHRGDILVFKFPGPPQDQSEPGEHFVKRVIGLPGDRIRVANRQVFLKGKAVQEPFVHHSHFDEMRPGDDFPPPPSEDLQGATTRWSEDIQNYVKDGEIVVPPESFFVMGDNREESWDSRFWGFVPRSLVSGRPLLVYWSYETSRDEYMQTTLVDQVSQIVDLIIHFPMKTRWRRMFRFVR